MNRQRISRRDFLKLVASTSGGLVVTSSLQACQSVAPANIQVPDTTPPLEAVELQLWHHWGGDREPLLTKASEDFSERHPGVTVELTLIPWDRKEESVITAVAAGNAPDVLHLIATETPVYAIAGALVPLDNFIAEAGISADEAIEVDWKGGIIEGNVWALPLNSAGSDHILFYHKQQFEEAGLDPEKPPSTWVEMKEYAETLTKVEGNDVVRLGVHVPADGWNWLYFIAQNDGEWLSEDGRQVLMDNDRSVEALQYLVDIYDIQGGWEKVQAYLSIARQTDPFVAEATSIYTSGSWVNYYIKTGNPDLPYGTGLAPNNRGPWHAGSYGPQQWVIPDGNQHADQAFDLALWLSRGDGGCQFLAPQELPSAWKACNDANEYAQAAAYWPTIEAAFETTRAEPPTPLFNHFLSIWDEMLQKALLHASAPEEAVQWGSQEMIKANDEFWSKQG